MAIPTSRGPRKNLDAGEHHEDDKWGVSRGVRYKKLSGVSKDAVAAFVRSRGAAPSISQARQATEEDEDFSRIQAFSGRDLDEMAGLFLPHLRKAPDAAEMAEIRRRKAELMREQERKRKEELAALPPEED